MAKRKKQAGKAVKKKAKKKAVRRDVSRRPKAAGGADEDSA